MAQQIRTPPFKRVMVDALFSHQKECTSRKKPLGEVGDWFSITYPKGTATREFEIAAIADLPLWFISKHLYRAEGFKSEGEFRTLMKMVQRGHPYDSTKTMKLHVLVEKGIRSTS